MKLQRYDGNPILSPNPRNEWESLVTTNPGAWYDADTDEVFLLYRAAGPDPEHRIYLGLARSYDGYAFERASDEPVFGPSPDGFDAGCVEDPRVVKMDDTFFITYACRAFPPGQYWLPDRSYAPPRWPASCPAMLRENLTTSGLAITRDFKSFLRAGRVTDPRVDNRDVMLFPEKIKGKYWLIHRPALAGAAYGLEHPGIWISSSDDLLGFDGGRLLARGERDWETKIGGNTPPLRTPHGWLTIYHAHGVDRQYRLGAMLIARDDPTRITHRTRDWLMQPEKDYETQGYYNGVVFPCGKIVKNGTLFVYYGGADKFVGVATCAMEELIDYLLTCPVDSR